MVDLEKLQDAIPDITGKSYYWGKLAREAHDELAALRAERDELRLQVESLQNKWASRPIDYPNGEALASENDALRGRVAELEMNARRYSALRERANGSVDELLPAGVPQLVWPQIGMVIDFNWRQLLDSAVDMLGGEHE